MAKWFRKKLKDDSGDRGDEPEMAARQSQSTSNDSPEAPAENSDEADPDASSGFFGFMRPRLQRTRHALVGQIDRLAMGKKEIDEDVLEELEEILITSDLGVEPPRN